MIIRDRKAKTAAIPEAAEKGRNGILSPKAMESAAPREAPVETPRVEPSARGFFRRPCIAAPHMESEAPVSATQSTLGSRTESRMEAVLAGMFSGRGEPVSAEYRTARVSAGEIATLPAQTQTKPVISAITGRTIRIIRVCFAEETGLILLRTRSHTGETRRRQAWVRDGRARRSAGSGFSRFSPRLCPPSRGGRGFPQRGSAPHRSTS